MKFCQFPFFQSVFFSLLSFLAANPIKTVDSGQDATTEGSNQVALPFHTNDFKIKYTDLCYAWNEKFPGNQIAVSENKNFLLLQNVAIQYGAIITAYDCVNIISNDSENFEEMKKDFQAMITNTVDKAGRVKTNAQRGYTGSVPIYFLPGEWDQVKAELKKAFPKIYGLEVVAGNLDFEKALKAVYGEGKEILFDKIKVDPDMGVLENLQGHLSNIPTEPIAETETDSKLKALKTAITEYNANQNDDLLETVKIAWLNQLKGNVVLPQQKIFKSCQSEHAKSADQFKPEIIVKKANTETIGTNAPKQSFIPISAKNKKNSSGWSKWVWIGGGLAAVTAAVCVGSYLRS